MTVVVIITDQRQMSQQYPHFNVNIINEELLTERFIIFITNQDLSFSSESKLQLSIPRNERTSISHIAVEA
jgi:hypothetical protein